jgi:hypothetical protein
MSAGKANSEQKVRNESAKRSGQARESAALTGKRPRTIPPVMRLTIAFFTAALFGAMFSTG